MKFRSHDRYRDHGPSAERLTDFNVYTIHKIYELLCGKPKNERIEDMTITQELNGILTAATALQQEVANPTQSVLTPSDQSLLDQVATVVGAPTSTSAATPAAPAPVTPPTATS